MDNEEFDFEAKYADDLDVLEDLENEQFYEKTLETVLESKVSLAKQENENKIDDNSNVRGSSQNLVTLRTDAKANDNNEEIAESPRLKRARHDFSLSGVNVELFDCNVKPLSGSIVKENKVLKRIPAGSYVSNTTTGGTRVYMRLLSENEINYKEGGRHKGLVGNLLAISCRDLRTQLQKEKEMKFFQDANIISEHSKPRDSCIVEYCNNLHNENMDSKDLWVDKYKPSAYLDLLSDNGTNRLLLRWLKLWDKVVFNREVKLKLPSNKALDNHLQPKQKQKFQKKVLPEVHKELDNFNRPLQKVALLCGPPGLGKTTLAHVIAKHAGYNAVEMNASDDRSPEAFRHQIEAATQMRSVIGEDPKPNCLIIDEIDGAPLASINLLVSMISSIQVDSNTKGRKKRHKNKLLLRPIICICNDQYVPALRPLRNCALVLNFPPTLPSRLASRLLEISVAQALKTDSSALMALCEKADNDIRSCLATLQFICNKQKELRLADVCSLNIGQKDVQKNLFSVWQDVFHISKSKRKRLNGNDQMSYDFESTNDDLRTSSSSDSSLTARYYRIQKVVQSYGDIEKIYNGLFSNYLSMNYRDNMELTSMGIDWMCFSDIFLENIHHSQNYLLMAYLPYVAVIFHFLFASDTCYKIKFPTAHFEFHAKLNNASSLLAAVINELPPSLYLFLNASSLTMDFLPLFKSIIQPNLRPINVQLYTTQEKDDMKRLIDIMIAYNITYKQELMPDGHLTYRTEPPIEIISSFSEMNTDQALTLAAKQIIAREVEIERLRRNTVNQEATVLQSEAMKSHKRKGEEIQNHRKVLQPRLVSCKEKPSVDFFGRIIPSKTAELVRNDESKVTVKPTIWFHFKEGYSNAVRKQVLMKDLY